MYDVIQWNEYLDLSFFYEECKKLNYTNNLSQEVMIDPFKYDPNFVAFILYKNQRNAIGSIVCHSFDDVMGPNSIRTARICLLEKKFVNKNTWAKSNGLDNYLLPAVFKHYDLDKFKIYNTTNTGTKGSHSVHKMLSRYYSKNNLITKVADNLIYRGEKQTVWQLHPKIYMKWINYVDKVL